MSARTFNLGTEVGSGGASLFLVYDPAARRATLRRPAFRKAEAEIVLTRTQLRDMLEMVSSMDSLRDRELDEAG